MKNSCSVWRVQWSLTRTRLNDGIRTLTLKLVRPLRGANCHNRQMSKKQRVPEMYLVREQIKKKKTSIAFGSHNNYYMTCTWKILSCCNQLGFRSSCIFCRPNCYILKCSWHVLDSKYCYSAIYFWFSRFQWSFTLWQVTCTMLTVTNGFKMSLSPQERLSRICE